MNEENMNENKVSRIAICSLLLGIVSLLFLFIAFALMVEGFVVFSGFLGFCSLLMGIWDLIVGLKKGLKSGLNVKLAFSGIFISLIVLAFLLGFFSGLSFSNRHDSTIDYDMVHVDELERDYPLTLLNY